MFQLCSFYLVICYSD